MPCNKKVIAPVNRIRSFIAKKRNQAFPTPDFFSSEKIVGMTGLEPATSRPPDVLPVNLLFNISHLNILIFSRIQGFFRKT